MGHRKGLKNIDWITFSIYLGLVAIGWLMIYSVGYHEEHHGGFFSTSAGKQAIWVGIAAFIFLFISLIDWKFWRTFSYLIYAFSLALLVAVLFFGENIKGATSWFTFGGFSFQPSELGKFATALALSNYLSAYDTDLRLLRHQLIAFSLFLLPMGLILLQPDAGSAFVFLSFFIVLFREGLSPTYYVIGIFLATVFLTGLIFGPAVISLSLLLISLAVLAYNFNGRKNRWLGAAVAFAATAIFLVRQGYMLEVLVVSSLAVLAVSIALWRKKRARVVNLLYMAIISGAVISYASDYAFNNILKPHQQDRINVWLQPGKCDPRGSLYNVLQSKMAIGSGGFGGKGFLEGTMTKLNYVPEQSTDFIFCTIGEEQGFIGSFAIISLFFLLLYRITVIAERQRSNFSRHYAYSIAGILFVHFFINIGMTMGLMPIIGIPLPFLSKGGSSLLGFTAMIAVLLKVDSNRYQI